MEELETLERFECPECPGPPPEFRLPPPPRPPFLTEGTFCPETIPDLEDCGAFPMIDPSYHTNPSLQSTALIITCAVVLLLMAAIVSVVFWKHKRKVQNILPCKSAAGAAAAAAAAASAGRVRVLPDGQPLAGTMSTGSAVLYEDLPDSGVLPQLHNHLGSHHHHHHNHQSTGQPTIEVRGTNHSAWQQRSKMERIPAPHHLDYLDYRDPRSILRVAEKPSRAVLGGYRTPRALLAKSQGVPLSIANNVTTHYNNNERVSSLEHFFENSENRIAPSQIQPNNNDENSSSGMNYTSRDTIIRTDIDNRDISQFYEDTKNFDSLTIISDDIVGSLSLDKLANYNENDRYEINGSKSLKLSRNRDNNDFPITPTHRSRINSPSAATTITSQIDNTNILNIHDNSYVRRKSVDSEGYSYIDFDDPFRAESISEDNGRFANNTRNPRLTSMMDRSRNNSIDSEGYSYIEPCYRRAPGTARRIANDGYTDDEICPLCAMQQIQNLLARPEDYYSEKRDT